LEFSKKVRFFLVGFGEREGICWVFLIFYEDIRLNVGFFVGFLRLRYQVLLLLSDEKGVLAPFFVLGFLGWYF
jgi:hypothetical protein